MAMGCTALVNLIVSPNFLVSKPEPFKETTRDVPKRGAQNNLDSALKRLEMRKQWTAP
jgi:hypothetical protein